MEINNAYSICTCSRSCLDQMLEMSSVQQPRDQIAARFVSYLPSQKTIFIKIELEDRT